MRQMVGTVRRLPGLRLSDPSLGALIGAGVGVLAPGTHNLATGGGPLKDGR